MSKPLDLTPPTGDRLAHVRAATAWTRDVPRDAAGKPLVTLDAWLGHDNPGPHDADSPLGRLWANHGLHN